MIRGFETSDTEQVMAVWLDATKKGHFFVDDSYWEKTAVIVREQYIPVAETYVYEKEGKILGFVSILSEDTIGGLFVDVDKHRCGIGKALVDHVKEKFEFLSVSAFKKNLNARAFYEKQGFVFDYEQTDLNTNELECVYNWKR